MKKIITSEIVVGYSQCPYKAYLLLCTSKRGSQHEYIQILEKQRQIAQRNYIEDLRQENADIQPYSLDNLKGNHKYLANATLEADGYSAKCAVLTKVRTHSAFGHYSYEPTIVVGSHTIKKEHRLELFFVSYVLERVQEKRPIFGYIVGMDGKSHRVKLENSSKTLIPFLEPLQEWVAEETSEPPSLILNKNCPACQFRDLCREKTVQEDNLSLLDGISTQRAINKYEKKGLFTVKQLSYTFKPRKRRKRVKNPPSVIHKPELQALAIREQKIYLEELPELTRQPVEFFLDIEGIPDQQFYYLLGLLVSDKGTTTYHPFWADTPEDEAQIWGKFLEKVNQYPDAPIYHYGSFEPRTLIKLGRRYDTDIEDLINRLVNVNKHIYGKVHFPVYSNRLKELGTFIGTAWTSPKASGLQSLVWRHHWDETQNVGYQKLLVTYNEEDCAALKLITDSLSEIGNLEKCINVNEMKRQTPFKYGRKKYVIDDFETITQCAYFDYQRKKIYLGANNNLRRKYVKRQRLLQRNYRINQYVDVIFPEHCPICKNTNLRQHEKGKPKLVVDLKFFNGGIKRWVTKVAKKRFFCLNCNKTFVPDSVKGLGNYGRNLMAWSVNQHVAHRMSLEKISDTLAESFNIHLRHSTVRVFRATLSKTYQATYNEIKQSILDGKLIHADETRVSIRGVLGYVWVLTNIDSVFYTYRATRETKFLTDMLADFKGVLISDFYPGYDSLSCMQQKCLIHLVRDLNDDLFKNPLDLEFEQLVMGFAHLLRSIVTTIDKYGLKKRNLNKHQQDVEKFYRRVIDQSSKSELTQKYQKRFRKYKESLFLFLKHDGIPWNNNNAEHAIKPFTAYRRSRDGLFTEQSIQEFLVLLSVQQTCKYQEISFFEFLKSGKQNLAEIASM